MNRQESTFKKFFLAGTFIAFSLFVFIFLALASRETPISQILSAQNSAGTFVAGTPISPRAKPENCLRIATINCNNYLTTNRRVGNKFALWPKPRRERAALARLVATQNADVVALQEMGDEKMLQQFRNDLKKLGADFPFFAILQGRDEDRHLAILSKIDFGAVEKFPEKETMSRGILAAKIEFAGTPIEIFTVHFKSRLPKRKADDLDPAEQRLNEANRVLEILRERQSRGNANFVLLGDFNDEPNSVPVKLLADSALFADVPARDEQGETWTFFSASKNLRDTSDYIFCSRKLAERIPVPATIFIAIPDRYSAPATDHRLLSIDLQF